MNSASQNLAGAVDTMAQLIGQNSATTDQMTANSAEVTRAVENIASLLLGRLNSKAGGQRMGFMGIARIDQGDLVFLKELLEAGKVVPLIDRRYPLSETAEALRYLGEGHARGKVVITVGNGDKA
jgi:NADPH:quinone reductase-like Zn-dependent oxidoreductase